MLAGVLARVLTGVVMGVVALWMVVLSGYDIRWRRLPNWLTLPGAAAVMAGAQIAGRGLPAVLGAAALAGLYLLVHAVAPGGMGAGDVKLALGLGGLAGCFGAAVWFLAAVGAPLLTVLLAVTLAPVRRGGPVPHGPSMCVATAGAALLAF